MRTKKGAILDYCGTRSVMYYIGLSGSYANVNGKKTTPLLSMSPMSKLCHCQDE